MGNLSNRVNWNAGTAVPVRQGQLINQGEWISIRQGDNVRSRWMDPVGWQALAFPAGIFWSTPNSAASNLAAVSAGNGGSIITGINLASNMLLQEFWLYCTDTATARTAEWALFADRRNIGGLLDRWSATAIGTFSFTPAAASWRSSTPSSAPVLLAPGAYFIAVRNTSAAQTFGVGVSATGLTGAPSTVRTGSVAALGATLTLSSYAANNNREVQCALRGRIAGEATGF
jgi:hypothetical protein